VKDRMEIPTDGKISKGDYNSNGHTCGYRRMEEDFVQDGLEYSIDTSIPELII
jgi:hypothetical protein